MDYIGLGRRIKSARRALNLTQEELAGRVGISLSFLGHIERGSRKASMETLVKLANALGESLDQLMRDSLLSMQETATKETPMQTLRSPGLREAHGGPFDPQQEEAELINTLSNYLGVPISDPDDPFTDWDD